MASSSLSYHNNKHIESGSAAYSVGASAYQGYTVTFDMAYTSAPTIMLTERNSVSTVSNALGTRVMVYGTITTSGFTYRVYNSGSSNRTGTVNWAAIGD